MAKISDKERTRKIRVFIMRLNQIADEMDKIGLKECSDHIDFLTADLSAEISCSEADVTFIGEDWISKKKG